MDGIISNDYAKWLNELKARIATAQQTGEEIVQAPLGQLTWYCVNCARTACTIIKDGLQRLANLPTMEEIERNLSES